MLIPFKRTPVTVSILVLTLIVYYLQQKIPNVVEPMLVISQQFHNSLSEIQSGQYWRLFTPALLHFGLLHIAFNSLIFLQLGQIIEWRFNSLHLTAITLTLALTSNLAQYITTGPFFGGLSGVVYGLFGFIWIQGEINPRFGIKLPRQFVIMVLVFLVLFWFDPLSMFGVHIANSAHGAGLVVGMLMALLYFIFKIPCRSMIR